MSDCANEPDANVFLSQLDREVTLFDSSTLAAILIV